MSGSTFCNDISQLVLDMIRAVEKNNFPCNFKFPRAFTYMIYRIEDKSLPCETPLLKTSSLLRVFQILTSCVLLYKYDFSKIKGL